METPVTLGSLIQKARGLRWKAVIGSGATVAALTYLLGFLMVYLYGSSVRILVEREASQAEFYSIARAMVLGAPVLQMALTLVAARLVSLWAAGRFVAHGLLVGLSSSVFGQIIGLEFGSFSLGEAASYAVPVLIGGYLGGLWGKAAHEKREALYRVSRGIGASSSPQEILAAVGEELTGPDVQGLALWGVDDYGEGTGDLAPLASWSSDGRKGLEAGDLNRMLSLEAGPTEQKEGLPETPLAGEPLTVVREMDEEQGKGSVLILSLDAPDGSQVGMLAVAFGRRWRAARLAWGTTRAYETIGPQIALALENMRLLEEARMAGRETGVRDERQRLAHEIHDTLAQGFNSIVINLETMEKRLPPDAEAALGDLDLARSTARESLAEARRLVWALRPQALDRHSLPEALGMLVERWSAENATAAGVNVVGSPRQLAPEVEAAVLRTAQETLSNVRKHARADRVMLTLSYMGGSVVLDARDDGVGFEPEETRREIRTHDAGGFGLRAMRERISQLGGSVVVESEPGEGTSLAVELPYERPNREKSGSSGEARGAGDTERGVGTTEELR